MTRSTPKITAVTTVLALSAAACGSSEEPSASNASAPTSTVAASVDQATGATVVDTTTSLADDSIASGPVVTTDTDATEPNDAISTVRLDVWADNWMAVYVEGELIGEDSVPITTERSFNAESFVFEASIPFTIAIEAKDFMESDSGLEYIGEPNQQMGDGGVIAQITDLATGDVVSVTDGDWSALVVHRAPLNTDCEADPDPDTTCEFVIVDLPADWTSTGFDDSGWSNATEWSESAVSPKDGYDTIDWDASARFVWGADLEVDNTILLRYTVGGVPSGR